MKYINIIVDDNVNKVMYRFIRLNCIKFLKVKIDKLEISISKDIIKVF